MGFEPTPEEAKAAFSSYSAYFGTFMVEEKARTVTHRLEGGLVPGEVGIHLLRRYEFDLNGRLILMPVETPGLHLTWERIE